MRRGAVVLDAGLQCPLERDESKNGAGGEQDEAERVKGGSDMRSGRQQSEGDQPTG